MRLIATSTDDTTSRATRQVEVKVLEIRTTSTSYRSPLDPYNLRERSTTRNITLRFFALVATTEAGQRIQHQDAQVYIARHALSWYDNYASHEPCRLTPMSRYPIEHGMQPYLRLNDKTHPKQKSPVRVYEHFLTNLILALIR
jgi:hypothetical protein